MIQLTPKQQDIIDSPARVKLVMGGERSGKTTLAVMDMWEKMKKRNDQRYVALFIVSDKLLNCAKRAMIYLLPKEHMESITEREGLIEIITLFGTILLSTSLMDGGYDSITIDGATNNKYVPEVLKKKFIEIFMIGHVPTDKMNPFAVAWKEAMVNDIPDTKAFRLSSLDNPQFAAAYSSKPSPEFEKFMDSERYRREYLCKFTFSEKYQMAYDLWIEYLYKCEIHGRSICTGNVDKQGFSHPATFTERNLVINHAEQLRRDLESAAKKTEIDFKDLISAKKAVERLSWDSIQREYQVIQKQNRLAWLKDAIENEEINLRATSDFKEYVKSQYYIAGFDKAKE